MKVEAQLRAIYAQFPSLTVNADRDDLKVAAEKVIGHAAAAQLISALSDKDTYVSARSQALQSLISTPETSQPQAARRAVVSGLSAGGLVSAIVLAKAGYQVDAVEQREGYTRNIQFSSRQALADELASIDPALAQQYAEISAPLIRGYQSTLNGNVRHFEREAPKPGDATATPKSGEEMLSAVPISIVECKALEKMLFAYLAKLPNVTVHHRVTIGLQQQPDGAFQVTGNPTKPRDGSAAKPSFDLGTPDLVVVAEGSNSATRKALGIASAPASPTSRMIAGIVEHSLGGKASMNFVDQKRQDGTTERILTQALSSAKSEQSWVLTEVAEGTNLDPNSALGLDLDPTTKEYREAQQQLVEQYYRQQAALVMELPADQMATVGISGPIEGQRPSLFTLQQNLSEKASAGTNVVGLGDFVGNAHFTVGGGMATAAISHVERLKQLVFELELGADKKGALQRYDTGALEDTLAWGRRGIAEFYPDASSKDASEAFVKAVGEWRSGKVKSPLEALERILAPVSQSTAAAAA